MVAVVYRGETTFYSSRSNAITAIEELAKKSEGNDLVRYANILGDLDEGKDKASDYNGKELDNYAQVVSEHSLCGDETEEIWGETTEVVR